MEFVDNQSFDMTPVVIVISYIQFTIDTIITQITELIIDKAVKAFAIALADLSYKVSFA